MQLIFHKTATYISIQYKYSLVLNPAIDVYEGETCVWVATDHVKDFSLFAKLFEYRKLIDLFPNYNAF